MLRWIEVMQGEKLNEDGSVVRSQCIDSETREAVRDAIALRACTHIRKCQQNSLSLARPSTNPFLTHTLKASIMSMEA